MEEQESLWLPGLSSDVVSGVRGFNMCAYVVALEGWRRGLSLKWHFPSPDVTNLKMIGFNPIGKLFSLRYEDETHIFYRSRGDKVSNEAVDIGADKDKTKDHLTNAGLPSPKGKRFGSESLNEDILGYGLSIGFPLVVKPTFGSLGKGVITNISDEQTLRKAVSYVRSDLNYDNILIERFINGDDHRAYVIGDKVVGVIKRIPANIVGNSINTIEELIELKNEERKKNPHLATRLIHIDKEVLKFIQSSGYSLNSIPIKDEIIFLKGTSNLSSGGDSIDVTEEISTEVEAVAINAVKSISGLYHAGVDLIISNDRVEILEINPTAGICLHLFPMEGTARDVPSAIVDYYFPETKGITTRNTNIHFDYKYIFNNLLMSKAINELEVAPAPLGKLVAKRYIITGDVQGVGYRWWIRHQAIERDLHGYTRNLKNGNVVVVVAGTEKEIVDNFKDICYQGPDKADVRRVTEYEWEKPVKVGFEIKYETISQLRNKKNKELQDEKIKKDRVEKEKEDILMEKERIEQEKTSISAEREMLDKKYKMILNSRAWRYTIPFRKISDLIKGKKQK